ncbi:class I SAM-dependent methyltransferase [Thalassotalea crassostreae]|uniref:class I SAM-dependent methyltransferase n=1 Tax=Thalassotalea crassostreae TaxID=1763536 RepID=UPI000837F8C0
MENITSYSQHKITWLASRCRILVFSVLGKLEDGIVDVVEGEHTTTFGKLANGDKAFLQGKVIIHDPSAYIDFVKGGSIGAAEAFIDNKWSSPDLTTVIRIFAKAQDATDSLDSKTTMLNKIKNKFFHYLNRNSHSGSKKNILAHYDLGNELYTRFLDKEMMYSSAIYPSDDATLEQAQLYKLDKICQRLQLKESDHLLEIGTGWGGLAIYAATHYGCKVTTTTISDAQFGYAEQRVKKLGLEDKITLLKDDYRDLTGQYDKVVSIEMIEAVGYQYMESFFKQCNDRLKPGGRLLIQAITIADQRFEHYSNNVDFIQRYIFPGGFLPSITLMNNMLTEHTNCVVEELHDIGLDYARTLSDWRTRFLHSFEELKQHGYDERFKRLWIYYLGYCEGAFLQKSISTVHYIANKR